MSRAQERILERIRENFTSFANNAQHAGTASMLNTAEPTMVPTPKSPSVTKVPMTLMNNSGLELAAAITVAPATSSVTSSSVVRHFVPFYLHIRARISMREIDRAITISVISARHNTPNCKRLTLVSETREREREKSRSEVILRSREKHGGYTEQILLYSLSQIFLIEGTK